MRVAVIGCGDIAMSQHLPALKANRDTDIVAVIDTDMQRAQAAAAAFGVPVATASLADALHLSPGAVIVATPPQVTPKVTVEALRAGLDVLCEKPIATNLRDADAVMAAAQESGRLVQVGYKDRFHPLVRRLRESIQSGRFGSPIVVRISRFDETYRPADREHTERIGGFLKTAPPIVHEGSHATDLIGWMFGEVEDVCAMSLRAQSGAQHPTYHCAILRIRDGSIARLEVAWWFPHFWPNEFQVYGPLGTASLSRSDGTLTFHDGEHVETVHHDADWQRTCFEAQLASFVRAIASRKIEGADARAGRAALELALRVAAA